MSQLFSNQIKFNILEYYTEVSEYDFAFYLNILRKNIAQLENYWKECVLFDLRGNEAPDLPHSFIQTY